MSAVTPPQQVLLFIAWVRGWSWQRRAWLWGIGGLSEILAIFLQRNSLHLTIISSTLSPLQSPIHQEGFVGRNDAGWPFSYASLHESVYPSAGSPDWGPIQSRLFAHLQWQWFALDVIILGIIIAAGMGIVIGAWAIVPHLRGPLSRNQMALGIGVALALGVGWFFASANQVTIINQSASDTATVYHQLLQPVALLPLLPGIILLALTQGLQIVLDLIPVGLQGPIGFVTVPLVLLAAIGFPAALLSMGMLPLLRLIAWRTRPNAPHPATEDVP